MRIFRKKISAAKENIYTKLSHKTNIITVGGTGIGKAKANLFAEKGANVLFKERSANKLDEVVEDA